MEQGTKVHGFRTSFRLLTSECTNIPCEACEVVFAHEEGNGDERADFRSDLLEKCVVRMQPWDQFLGGCNGYRTRKQSSVY